MAKKKKSLKYSNQFHKQEAAERKKVFFMRLYEFFKAFGVEQYYKDITPKTLEIIYNFRYRVPKALPMDGHDISTNIISDLNYFVLRISKLNKIKIKEPDYEITVYDYFTVWISLISILDVLTEHDIKNIELVKKPFKDLGLLVTEENCNPEMFLKSHEVFSNYIYVIALNYSSLDTCIYWIKYLETNMTDEQRLQNLMIIHKVIPSQKYFVFNKSARLAYRVGWAFVNSGHFLSTLTPSQLGIQSHMSNLPMEVYIQKHALNRLSERIDTIPQGVLQNNLFQSLVEPKVILFKGKRLLEYYIKEHKAGYMLLEIQNGAVVIRTFLLLTNNGTPEGEMLQEITGLSKLDKQYLALDKISSFYSDDLMENEKIHHIIREAGCESLIHIYELNKANNIKSSQPTAQLMEQYLKLTTMQVESNYR